MSAHLITKFFTEATGRQKLVDLHHPKAQVSPLSPATISEKSATAPPRISPRLLLADQALLAEEMRGLNLGSSAPEKSTPGSWTVHQQTKQQRHQLRE